MLEARLGELEAVRVWSPRLVSKLEALIRDGDDFDLFRVNPYRFASDRGVDPAEAVDLFLHATKAGLFAMDWMIVCASCGNVFSTFRALERVEPRFTCDMCSMENDAGLDDYIQVGFTVSRDIREISYHDPARLTAEDLHFRYHLSSDVKLVENALAVQEAFHEWTRLVTYLEPGEVVRAELEARHAALAIRDVLHAASAVYAVDPDSAPEETALDLTLDGPVIRDPDHELGPFALEYPDATFTFPATAQIPRGPVSLRVTNAGKEKAALWVLAYGAIPDHVDFVQFEPVLSGKKLLSTQTFRSLFRSETVPDSETLRIEDLTYLFTDLQGSTAMYDTIGDANAYNLVRLHFDALTAVVEANAGAVVKTIGDAIMATFVDPVDAVRAAAEMLSRLDEFNRTNAADLFLKIGIHRGHSIAVTLNDRIDYFGQSVNVASRVQQLAHAGEIVLTGDVYHLPGVAEAVAGFDVTEEPGIMKGVEEEMPVYRLR